MPMGLNVQALFLFCIFLTTSIIFSRGINEPTDVNQPISTVAVTH